MKHFSNRVLNFTPFFITFFTLLFLDKWYFLQDDNYSQFTPVIIGGLDIFYSGNGFPFYNVYSFLGMPTASLGTYAFFYPITHLSYLVSKYILFNKFHFNTVFVFIHFFIGYFYCLKTFKLFRIKPAYAVAGALLFVFCGFNLYAVRSWYYLAPSVAIFPAVFYHLNIFRLDKLNFKNIALISGLFVLYIISGNIQFFVYSIFSTCLFLILRKRGWKNIYLVTRFLGITGVIAAFLTSPILLTSLLETRGLKRYACETCDITDGILPMLGIPVKAEIPCGWGAPDLTEYSAQFYHGAGPLAFVAVLFLSYRIIRKILKRSRLLNSFNALLLVALIAFLMALGNDGLLWNLQCGLPLLNSFQVSFKFIFYVQFFSTLIGISILSKLFSTINNQWLSYFFFGGISLYFVWHLVNSKQAFFIYNYNQPYEAVKWHELLTDKAARVLPVVPQRSRDAQIESSLNLNFSIPYGILSTNGYEALSNISPYVFYSPGEYGVRYLIISKQTQSMWNYNYLDPLNDIPGILQFDTLYMDDKVILLENKKYTPLLVVYDSSNNIIQTNFNIKIKGDGVEYDIPSMEKGKLPHHLMVNFIYRTGLRVFIDEEERIVKHDSLMRINIKQTSSFSKLKLEYSPYSFAFYKKGLSENPLSVKRRIFVNLIFSDRNWLKSVRQKAFENKIPLDSMAGLDADYMLKNP